MHSTLLCATLILRIRGKRLWRVDLQCVLTSLFSMVDRKADRKAYVKEYWKADVKADVKEYWKASKKDFSSYYSSL